MGKILNKGEILDRIIEFYNLKNKAELAKFLEVAPNTITNWYSRNSFDPDIIFTKCVDIDFNWLLGKNVEKNRSVRNLSNEFSNIPVIDISLAAGYGCHNNTYIDIQDTIQLPSSMITPNATYFCARVKGQSMIPTLQDDSYLILRLLDHSEWQYMRDNYIYAVSDRDGMAYIKRIKNRFREHGFITLMSDNLDKANYPNFNLHEDEIQTILYAEWYLSAKMPNINDTYFKKLNDLENTVNDIKDMLLNERKGQ